MPVINEEVSPNETSEYGRGNTQNSNMKEYGSGGQLRKKKRPKSSYSAYNSGGSPPSEGLAKKKKKSRRGTSITYSSIEYSGNN